MNIPWHIDVGSEDIQDALELVKQAKNDPNALAKAEAKLNDTLAKLAEAQAKKQQEKMTE